MSFNDAPIDPESAEVLRGRDLRFGLVDTADREAFTAWVQAEARGFHSGRPAQPQLDEQLRHIGYRRTSGVWDDTAFDAAVPVATVSSWPTTMTVPGERTVPAWAISSVTVAPTHQRRGIARALLEAELRTAHQLGLPVAILTVSEATIYSRFGFAPAAMTADLAIETRRASWTGPAASGRVHFVSLEQLNVLGRPVAERAWRRTPGETDLDDYLWGRLIGLLDDEENESRKLRAVLYRDEAGNAQGFAVYRLTGDLSDFAAHTVSVGYLCAATDDAAAGIWRYLLELPLVSRVVAPLRSEDEPVSWQVNDARAVRTTRLRDHLWVRILDIRGALEARRYSAPALIALDVTDPLHFTQGRYLLDIDASGSATVSELEGEAPTDAAAIRLTVNELGALYLGGVSARTLVRAGRIDELRPRSADTVTAAFRSSVAPWLSSWF